MNDTKVPVVKGDNFTSNFFDGARSYCNAVIEAATGGFASDKKELVRSAGHILQAMLNGNRIETLKSEWDSLREKGRIKDDYQHTEQHHACLQEMLDFLDNDKPDKTRFDFMKKIFLMAATEEVVDRESVLPHQFMRLCRQLSSGEILVLMATYKCVVNGTMKKDSCGINEWLGEIAGMTGLEHRELVFPFQEKLEGLGILSKRTHPDKSGVRLTSKNRLTDLGWSICKFIKQYDESEDQASTE